MLMSLALLQLCSANPLPAVPAPAKKPAATYTLPTSTLPGTNATFQYAAIGRGIQNYTCTSVGAVPVQLGAIAILYDATSLATSNVAAFNALPGQAVNVPEGKGGCFDLPPANKNLPRLGNHLFAADGTPEFELTAVEKSLFGFKNATFTAPAGSPAGPAGTGAVAWLQLTAKAGYPNKGLSVVYRVETAGGNPPATCPSTAVISVQYSAQYIFYV